VETTTPDSRKGTRMYPVIAVCPESLVENGRLSVAQRSADSAKPQVLPSNRPLGLNLHKRYALRQGECRFPPDEEKRAMLQNTWAGVSYEVGGEILIGKNYSEGWLFSLSDPADKVRFLHFRTDSMSVGAGLGGSAGVAAVFGFNIVSPHDASDAEGGIDFSLDFGIAGTSKYIRSVPDYLKFWFEFEKGVRRHIYNVGRVAELVEKYGKLKGISENTIKNSSALQKMYAGQEPAVVQIPLGTGLRVSLNYKWAVTDVLSWGTKNFAM
jgi:hypothetical protein